MSLTRVRLGVLVGLIGFAGASLILASGGAGVVIGETKGDVAPSEGGIAFREVSEETGFEYETETRSGIISDAGVYASDYDDDGWTDLLAIGGESPTLFDNEGGEFTASGQLDGVNESVDGAIFLDIDGDGYQDLVLLRSGNTPVVFRNDGGSLELTHGVIKATLTNPVGATAGDYDRDGCVDLFVVQNGDWTKRLPAGHESATVPHAEDNGNPNVLFDGDCDAFERVTTAGIRGSSWSLAASMVDLDDDGWPDIHVANDFNHDVVYWNEGNGTFTRTILPEETNRNAMASEVEDFSGDGRLDVFVTNIDLPPRTNGSVAFVADGRADGNNLLLNRGGRRFEPAGEQCGVEEGGWGWAAVGADLDNDGDTDLIHTTLEFTARLGMELLEARETGPEYSYPVLFTRRSGTACGFRSVNSSAAGFEVTDGHGVAGTDFDRDGDIDVAMAVSPGPTGEARYRLYENVGADGNAVQVRVVGQSATAGVRVFVRTETGARMRAHHSKTDYYAQDERVLHFGTGKHTHADVRVVWPDGHEQRFDDVESGVRLRVSRDGIERRIRLDGPSSTSNVLEQSPGVVLLALFAVVVVGVVGYRQYR